MKKQTIKWTAGVVAAGLAVSLLDAMVLEKFFFEVKSYPIGKPEGSRKLKLVLLSDLHFRKTLWPSYKKLAKKVNKLQPDLIMLTGDTLDRTGETAPMCRFLDLLKQDIPKVAIAGNHDHKAYASLSTLKQIYQEHNCRFLLNETTLFYLQGIKLAVTGLDDFIEGSGNFKAAVAETDQEEHHVLLLHSPLQQERVQEEIALLNKSRNKDRQLTISYIFAGHNHGGQVTLLGYPPMLPVKSGSYVKGWYNSQKPYLYVSKGFGTSTVPFRFGARAEVTLFNYFV